MILVFGVISKQLFLANCNSCDVLFCCVSGKQLKVYSLTTGKKKTLYDSCAGHFTTAPEVREQCENRTHKTLAHTLQWLFTFHQVQHFLLALLDKLALFNSALILWVHNVGEWKLANFFSFTWRCTSYCNVLRDSKNTHMHVTISQSLLQRLGLYLSGSLAKNAHSSI